MSVSLHPIERSEQFCQKLGMHLPIFLAPMAGACLPPLSIAVAKSGGAGAAGILLMSPKQIEQWCAEFRIGSRECSVFQLNNWIPDQTPNYDKQQISEIQSFLSQWGTAGSPAVTNTPAVNFDDQCQAMLEAKPTIISSIMGLYPNSFVKQMKTKGILWFATATSVAEALEAEFRGADVIVAQGMEAGGHRGSFEPSDAESNLAGLFSLLPAIADTVKVPVIATGGIADARGIAAALLLGASAVQIGTGYLRCLESDIPSAWADGIASARPHNTTLTRAFTGRLGRSLKTTYTNITSVKNAPIPAPYPFQRELTTKITGAARKANDLEYMQAWAGQSGFLAQNLPAGELTKNLWHETKILLS